MTYSRQIVISQAETLVSQRNNSGFSSFGLLPGFFLSLVYSDNYFSGLLRGLF